jgi:hypothetical protein
VLNAPADTNVRLDIGRISYTNAKDAQGAYLQLLEEMEEELVWRVAGEPANSDRTSKILAALANWGQLAASGAGLALAVLRGG